MYLLHHDENGKDQRYFSLSELPVAMKTFSYVVQISAEGSMPKIRYAEHLRDDISRIEQEEYGFQEKKVSFKFEFVPSDTLPSQNY